MKTTNETRLHRHWKLSFGLATLVLLPMGTAAAQTTTYTAIDLGTLGGTFSDTGGVNNAGQAVGGATVSGDTAIHAFLWNKGLMTDLGALGGPNSFANAVSNTTGAVGLSDISSSPGNPALCFEEFVFTTNQCHAFLWQDGVMRDLGTLGGTSSAALGDGVNSRGQVVGGAETPTSDPNNPPFQIFHGFLWDRGLMTDLGTLGGPNSIAGCVNDPGQVVGQSQTSATPLASCGCIPAHAFLWEGGIMSDLGTLGGNFSSAGEINNQGQVAGQSTLPGDVNIHAFLWEGGLMSDLGTLAGDVNSFAADISNKGQVVGGSCNAEFSVCRAFLWQNGLMTDLNTLIPADSPLHLVTAFQINARGQINGTAVEKSTGQVRGYLATPANGGSLGVAAMLGTQVESPKVALPEVVPKLLRQRLGFGRFRPGLMRPQ